MVRLLAVLVTVMLSGLGIAWTGGVAGATTPTWNPALNPQGTTTVNGLVPQVAAGGSTTPAQTYTRAQAWVAANVPYNQSATRVAPSAPTGPYRTDCSGFVSMAWGLSTSLTTQTLVNVSTQINASQLTMGDILDYNSASDPVNGSHVVMFVGWANSQHTLYTEDEEAGGSGAVQRTIAFPYDYAMDGSGSWIPYRYNNMIETPAPVVSSFTASSSLLPSNGGNLTLTAQASNATSYRFTSSTAGVAGLTTITSSTGTASDAVVVPANTTAQTVTDTFTVVASGPGGSTPATVSVLVSPASQTSQIVRAVNAPGYYILAPSGAVYAYGGSQYYGGANGQSYFAGQRAVGMAVDAAGTGYWILSATGGIYSYGSAAFYGSASGQSYFAGQTAASLTVDAAGTGYAILSTQGGVFAYGSSPFHGSAYGASYFAGQTAVSLVLDSGGGGYWILAASGGIYAYGNAGFYGTPIGASYFTGQRAVSLVTSNDSKGYTVLSAQGGVFAYGDGPFFGAPYGQSYWAGMSAQSFATDASGLGYWILSTTGGVYAYGNALYGGGGV